MKESVSTAPLIFNTALGVGWSATPALPLAGEHPSTHPIIHQSSSVGFGTSFYRTNIYTNSVSSPLTIQSMVPHIYMYHAHFPMVHA
jgi:hypothetical protein